MLFGYAINTTPRNLPTAVLIAGKQRSFALYLSCARRTPNISGLPILPHSEAEVDQLLASGSVLFAIEIPANFERSVRRGDKPHARDRGCHRSCRFGHRARCAR